jgi:hypothetical protein
MSGAYAVIAGIFFVDVVVLLGLKDVRPGLPQVHESAVKSPMGGLRYVRGHQTVLMLLVIACLLNLSSAVRP